MQFRSSIVKSTIENFVIYQRRIQDLQTESQRCPLPIIFFSILDLKMATLGAFWALFLQVSYFKRKKTLLLARKTCCCMHTESKRDQANLLITSITMTSYHTANQMDGWRGDGGAWPTHPLNLSLTFGYLLQPLLVHGRIDRKK